MTISGIESIFWLEVLLGLMFSSKIQAISIDEINIKEVVQLEEAMISKSQDYFLQEHERLSRLKTHLTIWKTWRNSNIGQESEYITFPQNLFHLFKILTLEWKELEAIIGKNYSKSVHRSFVNSFEINDNIKSIFAEIDVESLDEIEPLNEDHFKTIISSLIDLQYEYDMKPQHITNGTSKDLQLNKLPVDFCYLVGKTCFDYNNHLCATDWLSSCLDSTLETELLIKIIKLLYISHVFLNQTAIAYEYAKDSLNYNYYDTTNRYTVLDLGSQLQQLEGNFYNIMEANRICRGEHENPSKPNLKCRYNHDNSAFLKIAPLKEEELYDAPKILLYRDVLYDSEIEFVKEASAENMETALLAGHTKPTLSHRVTESGFLETDSPALVALEKRAEDMANLFIRYSEPWQVINYSPGGFYTVHSDYLPPNDIQVRILGNRMTTMLFYMNDVTLGGETVFPRIGVSAKPTKGAALIWHNIHANGTRNVRTEHSACPVILGEKWGFTKWVRVLKDRQCLRSIYESDLNILKTM